MLPAATWCENERLRDIARYIRTDLLFEPDPDGKLRVTKVLQVHFDRGDALAEIIAQPLLAVEGCKTVSRATAADRCDLDVMIPRPSRAAIGDVRDWRYAGDATVSPVLRGAILKIIDLANHDRLRRTRKCQSQ